MTGKAAIDRRRGLAITSVGVLAYTPDSLLIRLAAVESFTYVMLRGLIVATMLALRLGRRRRANPWPLMHRGGLGRPPNRAHRRVLSLRLAGSATSWPIQPPAE